MQGLDPRFRFPAPNMPRFPGPNMGPPGAGRGCFRPGGPPRQHMNQQSFNPRMCDSGPRFSAPPRVPFRPNGPPPTPRMPNHYTGSPQTHMQMSDGHPRYQRPPQFGPQRPQGPFQNQRPHGQFQNGLSMQRQGNDFQPVNPRFVPPNNDRKFAPINDRKFAPINNDRNFAPNNYQQRPQFNNGNMNAPEKKKKPKLDKRDRPENNRFYCDVCDRGYKDEDKYQAHIDSHEKCPKEGCPYVAVSKLVQLHIRLQHTAGLAKQIWTDSPEDIRKWRENRKRNYPTAENISRKKEELEQKKARGELIEEKYFGKMRNHGRGGHQDRGKGRGRFQGLGRSIGEKETNDLKRQKSDGNDNQDCSAVKKLKTESEAFLEELKDSLSVYFKGDDSDSDSDKESIPEETPSKTSPPAIAAGALGSLISAYQASDDEEDKNNEKHSSDKVEDNTGTTNGNNKIGKGGKAEQNQSNASKKKKKNKNKRNRYQPPPIDKSLLEKLLAKEIRQERNKILQCVYYIVNHGFFDKTST